MYSMEGICASQMVNLRHLLPTLFDHKAFMHSYPSSSHTYSTRFPTAQDKSRTTEKRKEKAILVRESFRSKPKPFHFQHSVVSQCSQDDPKQHPGLTFAPLCSVHAGEQDVVVVGPVDPLIGVIDGESGGAIDFCVDDDRLPAAVHADAADVGRLAAVHPEHVAESGVTGYENASSFLLLRHEGSYLSFEGNPPERGAKASRWILSNNGAYPAWGSRARSVGLFRPELIRMVG